MPLFAFISGLVYGIKPVSRDRWAKFLQGKVRRLVVPTVIAITAFAAFSTLVTQEPLPSPVWSIYLKSYKIFWFVQVILLIFVLLVVVELVGLTRFLPLLYVLAAAALIVGFSFPSDWFSLRKLTLLAPHFLLGMLMMQRWAWIEAHRRQIAIASIAMFLFGLAMNVGIYRAEGHFSQDRLDLQSYLFGTGATMTGILLLPRVRWLQWLGGFSFTIYLYHIFGTSAIRRVVDAAGVDNAYVHLLLGTLAGLLLPIALHLVAARWASLRLLLLGLKPRPLIPEAAQPAT